MDAAVAQMLVRAQAARDAGRWRDAISLFSAALTKVPTAADIRHNLALCHFATGRLDAALNFARQAVALRPELWQSRMIEARVHKSRGQPVEAETALAAVLRYEPYNPAALAAMADLDLNEFGDPAAAMARLQPVAGSADAELTALMAGLYLGLEPADIQSAKLKSFAKRRLSLRQNTSLPRASRIRKRVGLMSPLFSGSPVYFLTFSTIEALAAKHDLILFQRGTKSDWATEKFQAVASEWHEAAHLEPGALAAFLGECDLDIMIDLGGWTDAAGLAALSSKPAARMFTWVGGQSATTGLSVFDGWIGDVWQSPVSSQPLYSEPLINIAGGYCDYRPPANVVRAAGSHRRRGVGLIGNPSKFGAMMTKYWPRDISEVFLIDRRYAHARTRERVVAMLRDAGVRQIEVIAPGSHNEYVEAVAHLDAVINTIPYSAGLTALEASVIGAKILNFTYEGRLFCERHHLSHQATGGRNPELAAQILRLIG